MGKRYILVQMRISDGQLDGFRSTLRDVMKVVGQQPAGLSAYEWFLSADGHECTVLEAYNSPPDHAQHMQRVVIPHASRLREHASSRMALAGDVPAPMLTQMRARLGDVPYYGPAVASVSAAAPAVQRVVLGRFKVPRGAAPALNDAFNKSVRARNQAGSVRDLTWFINEDEACGAVVAVGSTLLAQDVVATLDDLFRHSLIAGPEVQSLGLPGEQWSSAGATAADLQSGATRIEGIL